MNHGRRRRILSITCVVVAIAWMADHFLGVAVPATAGGAEAPEPALLSGPSTDVQRLVESLLAEPAEATTHIHRDLFDPGNLGQAVAVWRDHRAAPIEPLESTEPAAAPIELTLTAIMDGRVRMAVVNDRVVTRGALLDGFRVQRIESDHVILAGPNEIRKLTLAKPEVEPQSPKRSPSRPKD